MSYFPVYNICDFRAEPDGISTHTEPIQSAIDGANEKDGGVVYFSHGDYVTETISLRNNVTHLS